MLRTSSTPGAFFITPATCTPQSAMRRPGCPGGQLAIAIYNRVTEGGSTPSGGGESSGPTTTLLARPGGDGGALRALLVDRPARSRENPFREAREYRRSRGMALRTDLVDWLGGYPYEFATVEEIVDFCEGSCGLASSR